MSNSECTVSGPKSWLSAKKFLPDANLFIDEATALSVARQMERRAYRRGLLHAGVFVVWVIVCNAVAGAVFAFA